mgnify:CR=1 FL=1
MDAEHRRAVARHALRVEVGEGREARGLQHRAAAAHHDDQDTMETLSLVLGELAERFSVHSKLLTA